MVFYQNLQCRWLQTEYNVIITVMKSNFYLYWHRSLNLFIHSLNFQFMSHFVLEFLFSICSFNSGKVLCIMGFTRNSAIKNNLVRFWHIYLWSRWSVNPKFGILKIKKVFNEDFAFTVFVFLGTCIVIRNGKIVRKVVWIDYYLQLNLSSRRY